MAIVDLPHAWASWGWLGGQKPKGPSRPPAPKPPKPKGTKPKPKGRFSKTL